MLVLGIAVVVEVEVVLAVPLVAQVLYTVLVVNCTGDSASGNSGSLGGDGD